MMRSSSGIAASERQTPLNKTKFAILDTSVYIENFRTGRFTFRILQATFITPALQSFCMSCSVGLDRDWSGGSCRIS